MQPQEPATFSDLVDEVRLTFHALGAFAARAGNIDPPGRAVLEFLNRNGPTTVPEIARRRGVTRQHIQTIVNALGDGGLVTTEPNPAHQRSHLIALTTAGVERITAVTSHERTLLAPFVSHLDPPSLAVGVDLLRGLRMHLDALDNMAAAVPATKEHS